MIACLRMRSILRFLLFSLISLYIASLLVEGFSFGGDWGVLLLAVAVFGIANLSIKPLLKMVTLPFNILTLGAFSLVINALLLYLTVRIVPGLALEAFRFSGWELPSVGVTIAPFEVSFIGALIFTSVVISSSMMILGSICKK
jgi:putative membrane protein